MNYVEAIWTADEHAKVEIDRRAKVYAFGKIVERGYKTTRKYAAIVDQTTTKFIDEPGGEIGEFKEWHEAYKALEDYVANFGVPNEDQQRRGHNRALHEVAKSCVETYDSWQRGDNYGVICVDYDAQGEQIDDEDACWGYIGLDYAKEIRDEYLKEVTKVKEAA